MIATNAQKIVDVRAKGYKPDELVLVSLIGRINEPNHTVYASDKREYIWSWVRGLEICIYSTTGLDWKTPATEIAKEKPAYLSLWDAGRSEGAELWYQPDPESIHLPQNQWRYLFNYMPWTAEQNRRFQCS